MSLLGTSASLRRQLDMTSQQIADFIVYKATPKLREIGCFEPKLGLTCPSHPIGRHSKVFLTIRCSNFFVQPFYLRLVENAQRKMLTLDIKGRDFEVWKSKAFSKAEHGYGTTSFIEYDLSKMPKFIVDSVTSSIVRAIKTPNVGLDLFNLTRYKDITLVETTMSYEEAEIESDLHAFTHH